MLTNAVVGRAVERPHSWLQEMERVTQESIRKAAIFDEQSAKYTQMEAANKKLEAEVDGFDSKV